jgi:hypothetical protein
MPRDVERAFANADTTFHTSLATATSYDQPGEHIRQWRNQLRIYRQCHGIGYTPQELLAIWSEHRLIIDLAHEAADRCDDEGDQRLEAAVLWHVAGAAQRAGAVGDQDDLQVIVGTLPNPFGRPVRITK